MSEDRVRRAFETLDRPPGPSAEFEERLWAVLRDEMGRPSRRTSLAPGRPGRRPEWRRLLTIAAALAIGIVAVVAVLPIRSGVPETPGDIGPFGGMPPFRATIERRVPAEVIQGLLDAIAEERGDPEAPTVSRDEVAHMTLVYADGRWRLDVVDDSLYATEGIDVTELLDENGAHRSPGSVWLGDGDRTGVYSGSTGTWEPTAYDLGTDSPLHYVSWDATPVAATRWRDACDPGEVLGAEPVAGRSSFHVRCGSWDVWVDAEHGLLLRIVSPGPDGLSDVDTPQIRSIFGSIAAGTLEVTSIEFGATIADDDLSFDPPPSDGGPDGAAGAPTRLEIGGPVPLPTGELLGGDAFDASSVGARRSALYVWATWCPPCTGDAAGDPLTTVDAAGRAHADDPAVVLVSWADDRSSVETFVGDRGLEAPVVVDVDSGWLKSLGASGIPLLVLVDEDGGLAGAYMGGIPADELRAILDAFASGEPLPAPSGDVTAQLP